MFKIFVISLSNPKELFKTLKNNNIEPILVKGINGKKLSNKVIKENTTLLYSYFGSKSSIGIAMSHMKAWKTFLKTNDEYAIIFEDDVIIEPNFTNDLEIAIKKVPTDFDMLYLGCFGCEKSDNVLSTIFTIMNESNNDNKIINNYINKPIVALGAHAYIISRKGAKKLLNIIEGHISYHIDYVLQHLSKKKIINTYSLNNRIAYQTSTDSVISANVSNSHPLLLNNFLSNYYIDKKCKANYLSTVSIFRIGNIDFTLSSILFLFIGIILSFYLDIIQATTLYLLISLPDIKHASEKYQIILIHYILFITPFIIKKL